MKTVPWRAMSCLLLTFAVSSLHAASYSVGGAGCTHPTLQAALNAAATAAGGPHRIKLAAAELTTVGLTLNAPAHDITIEGGYAGCTSEMPTAGASTTIRQTGAARVWSMTGGDVALPRRTITLMRVRITGGNAAAASGGGIFVGGKLELRLAQGAVVTGNHALDGGGVALYSGGEAVEDVARLRLDEGAMVRDNSASRFGGGLHLLGGANATLLEGGVNDNTASLRGGGIYLDGPGTDLRIQTFGQSRVTVDGNTAGLAAFSTGNGYGGAIYSARARVLADTTGSPGEHKISLSGNTANFGGAIYAEGPTNGTFTFIELRDSAITGNYARGKGGAFYSRFAVDWVITHDSTGPCAVFLLGLVPCSLVFGNAAGNEGAPGFPGGGVFFLASDAGVSRSIARVRRTLFQSNEDIDGRAAIIEAEGANEYLIERSLFKGNIADGGGGTFAALFRSGSANSWLLCSTVLDNHVDRLFVFGGTTLNVTGSIFWDPGTTIWMQPPSAMTHGDCLISHTTANLPGSVLTSDPRLDSRGRPRRRSDAWDYCATAAAADAEGRNGYDIPGVTNAYGLYDLGAYEQADVIFTHGMGSYPIN